MKEELISLKTAKLAKEKGFTESCEYAYVNDFEEEWNLEDIEYNDGCVFDNKFHNNCSAPTQSLLQRWLREVHDIDIIIHRQHNNPKMYYSSIWYKSKNPWNPPSAMNKLTYEEALEEGLYEALKLINK